MKKIFFSAIAALLCFSCGYEDLEALYDYTSALFTYQDYNRNLVVGEGLEMNVGITLAGVVNNKKDRVVRYEVDASLLDEVSDKSLLPSSYYSVAATAITVPKGELKGYLLFRLDSAAFLADPKALTGEYVLPLRLVSSSDVDSISPDKDYIRIYISYYARQHGYYSYSGVVTATKDGTSTETAYSNIASETDSRRFLSTVAPNSFQVQADAKNDGDPSKGVYTFLLEAPIEGSGAVTLKADPASAIAITADGECYYDAAKKEFTLHYRYTKKDGAECRIAETLTFRNRIRDVQDNGLYVNEWR